MINDLWLFKCNIDNSADGVTFNDVYTEDGNLAIVTGKDAIVQLAAQSIWLWYGEWVLNTTIGVTYRRILGGSAYDKQPLTQYQIENAIMQINNYIPDVYKSKYGIKKVVINNYNVSRSNRALNIDVTIILNSSKVKVII